MKPYCANSEQQTGTRKLPTTRDGKITFTQRKKEPARQKYSAPSHSDPVEKDLLEFTNSLSKTIGSPRQNVLSPLVSTTDIIVPTFQQPELGHSDPIRACLCELKGIDSEERLVVCEKNCCCLIFLDPCQCGLEFPAPPSKASAARQNTSKRDQHYHTSKIAASGMKDTESDCKASTKPKLRTTASYDSLTTTAQRSSRVLGTHMKGKRETRHEYEQSQMTVKTCNATAHLKTSELTNEKSESLHYCYVLGW